MNRESSTETQATRLPSTVNVKRGERQVLFVAPDNEGTRKWGVYGIPDMYRAADGSVVIYDRGHMDSHDRDAGCMAEAIAFRSTDNGSTWETVDPDEYGHPNKVFFLADGGKVQFQPKAPPTDLKALGVTPEHLVMSPTEYGLLGVYRYRDIPLDVRTFQVNYQPPQSAEWQTADAVFDIPELRVVGPVKAKTGPAVWPDVTSQFSCMEFAITGLYQGCTGQEAMVESSDGAWLSAIVTYAQTERNARFFAELHCIASTDRGKTWTLRGSIFNQQDLTTFGATEEFSMIRLGNEIVCVDRTDLACRDSHRFTVLARSSDNGFTWSVPEPVASSSVTPHLVKLENGVVALVFGRPGVHVQFSTDGCHSWNTLTSLIGKTMEEELAAGRDVMEAMYFDTVSYSNTRTVITGPDRFLVLYTDFKYGGESRKAIVIEEVVVAPK